MTTSQRIQRAKASIKKSQSNNVTAGLWEIYEELINRRDDRHFQSFIFTQIVAANESFFKESIASLINLNEKFLENSKALTKKNGSKFELEDMLHISKSNITLGDLIAFSLKYSSIESLLKTFQEISELDILKMLKEIESDILDYDDLNVLINDNRPLDKNRIIKNLKEVYEIRNVICHDFLSSTHTLTIEYEKLTDYLLDAIILQDAVTYLCSNKIYSKYYKLDYDERIAQLNGILAQKQNELQVLENDISKELNEESRKQYLKSVEAFNDYLDKDSLFFGEVEDSFKDLTIENKIYLIDQRIHHLRDEIRKAE